MGPPQAVWGEIPASCNPWSPPQHALAPSGDAVRIEGLTIEGRAMDSNINQVVDDYFMVVVSTITDALAKSFMGY